MRYFVYNYGDASRTPDIPVEGRTRWKYVCGGAHIESTGEAWNFGPMLIKRKRWEWGSDWYVNQGVGTGAAPVQCGGCSGSRTRSPWSPWTPTCSLPTSLQAPGWKLCNYALELCFLITERFFLQIERVLAVNSDLEARVTALETQMVGIFHSL